MTEDNVPVKVGDRVYNYYDMEPGFIRSIDTVYNDGKDAKHDIWFNFSSVNEDYGSALLNGQRICSIEFARQRGFRGA